MDLSVLFAGRANGIPSTPPLRLHLRGDAPAARNTGTPLVHSGSPLNCRSGRLEDKTTPVYNGHMTLKGIPLEAYDYVANGKSALDWVVERQCVKTDRDSGIVNEANAWATGTMKIPKYSLEFFMRVITVSLETRKIVKVLPMLDIGYKIGLWS